MLMMPDLATLRLCSMMTSFAFAMMFTAIWAGGRRPSYLLHWAASAALYAFVLEAFDHIEGRGAAVRSAVFGLLAATDLLILTGVRAFRGASRYRAAEPGMMVAAVVIPVLAATTPSISLIPSAASFDVSMIGLAASKMLIGGLLAFDRRVETPLGQRLAGLALLAYVPVYAVAIVAQHMGMGRLHLAAVLPMLADQLLLAALNIALMSMPAERAHRSLKEKSLRDPLTGVRNRAWLESYKDDTEIADAAVIIVDIDHFKLINDRYGHAAGDQVLTDFAARANVLVEAEQGMLARLGGDEFIAIFPDADAERAGRIARDLLNSLRTRSPGAPIATASLGVAVGGAGEDLSGVMARADHRLYEAKAAGRDRVAIE